MINLIYVLMCSFENLPGMDVLFSLCCKMKYYIQVTLKIPFTLCSNILSGAAKFQRPS